MVGCGSILAGVEEVLQRLRSHEVHDLDRCLLGGAHEDQHIRRSVEIEDIERTRLHHRVNVASTAVPYTAPMPGFGCS